MDATTLESDRLFLRPFDLEDAKRVQELAGDRKISDTAIAVPYPYEDGMAEEWISTHARLREDGQEWIFAITLQSAQGSDFEPSAETCSSKASSPVGAITLRLNAEHRHAEIGYWIGVPYWGRGFATEAAQRLLEFGFDELNLHRVHAHYLIRNEASGRVLTKLGMRHEGTIREYFLTRHGFEDVKILGITRNEFLALRDRTI